MTKPENHPVPRHERVSGSTPDLFERCGVALCQGDPAWKARFAKMLRMSVDSVDAMAPNVWREIAAIFRAWEQAYPILREAAIEAAGGPLPVRRYTFPGGAELPIEAKEGGVFPAIEYTAGTNGDTQYTTTSGSCRRTRWRTGSAIRARASPPVRSSSQGRPARPIPSSPAPEPAAVAG